MTPGSAPAPAEQEKPAAAAAAPAAKPPVPAGGDAAAGGGLLQFPKIDPSKMRPLSEAGNDAPFSVPIVGRSASKPAEPPKADKPREPEKPQESERREPDARERPRPCDPQGPPATVIRRGGGEPSPSKRGSEAPFNIPARRDEPSRRSTTAPPKPAGRPGAPTLWIGAAAASIAIAGATAVFLGRGGQSEAPSATAGSSNIFAKGSSGLGLDAKRVLGGSETSAPPRRVAFDPNNPHAGAVEVPTLSAGGERKAVVVVVDSGRLPGVLAPDAPRPPAVPTVPASVASQPRGPAPTPMPGMRSPTPTRPISAQDWVFEGVVYDLISLTPVYAATLEFRDTAGDVRADASTDSSGRYRVTLPVLASGGYKLRIGHHDYMSHFLDEMEPPFREITKDQRMLLARSPKSANPWIGRPGKSTRRDLVLLPKLIPSE